MIQRPDLSDLRSVKEFIRLIRYMPRDELVTLWQDMTCSRLGYTTKKRKRRAQRLATIRSQRTKGVRQPIKTPVDHVLLRHREMRNAAIEEAIRAILKEVEKRL